MNSALEENPPPSFSEVARRIGCTRENLKKKLPELSEALNQRYKSYLTKTRSENLQLLHEEIEKAVMKLQDEKNFVSMNKVKALLPRKWNDRNFKSAYRKVMQNDES
jgi:predicted nuclease with TOPRIM domain